MSCTLAESNYAVARQPIYLVDGGVYGYELLYRTVGGPNFAMVPSDAEATLAVLANGIQAISQDIGPDKKIFINFSREILEKGYYSFLDPARFVLEVLETVSCNVAFAETLRGIGEAGYMLALDDYVGDPAFDALLPVVTFVKIDMLALRDDPDRLEAVVATCQARGKEILAEKVETEADLEFCRARDIPLAQGFYYSRPQVVTTRVLDAGQTTRLGLLAELAQPEVDMARVRETIAADVALTYKLLRHVNAASSYRGEPVESLRFALDLLGRKALWSWVTVNLLASLAATPRDLELAFVSAVRGRFLAQADQARGGVCHKGGGMCLLGLLSLLDAMLGLPMDKALSGLPIDAAIRDALLGRASHANRVLSCAKATTAGNPPRPRGSSLSPSTSPTRPLPAHITRRWPGRPRCFGDRAGLPVGSRRRRFLPFHIT